VVWFLLRVTAHEAINKCLFDLNPSADQRSVRTPPGQPFVPDAQAMRLFSQYRLFLLAALACVYYLSSSQTTLGQRDAILFEVAHLGYAVVALGFIYLQRIDRPAAITRLYLQNYLDISFLCIMMYACGGVQSGFGILLIITIALLSQLNTTRYTLFFAALACVLILLEELLAKLLIGNSAADFERSAYLGAMLLLVAWLLSVPIKALAARQIPEPTHDRAALDVKDIANLNEEIIRELDSGVLVIDSHNHVQLINDTARALLSAEFTPLPIHIGRLCSTLLNDLSDAKRGGHNNDPFTIESTGYSVLPHYISLSSGGMLIRLDDHAQMRKQYQQLKLASLGRLSASIAHEIRNPLGAISHSVQLLQESPHLKAEDEDLLDIAQKNTHRINRIVEDVLQLSNRKQVNYEPINLSQKVTDFCVRFANEHKLDETNMVASTEPNVFAQFDVEHLDQVLWNLCTNARLHNDESTQINISCWQSQQGVAIIDIVDNGVGIADLHREHLFEPFYSTHHQGSGLGLYIIRELCDLNKANIECIDRKDGAHFRITLNTAQQMAA